MTMRLIRERKGQSMAEYAVLFAVVIGAAVAMQQYIKSRLQASVAQRAEEYRTASGTTATRFDPTRRSVSSSGTDQQFHRANQGEVLGTGGSRTRDDKATD